MGIFFFEKKKRRGFTLPMRYGFIVGALLLSMGLSLTVPVSAEAAKKDQSEENLEINRGLEVQTNEVVNWPQGPTVGAESAILIEAKTGAILYGKNIHYKEYPASTTKLLTCLIAAERCGLEEMVDFSYKAVFDTPRDSNHIAIDVGEKLTVEECLEAVLIRSANECSFALAEHVVGGDWEGFSEVMNERAEQLGCVDSNFVNPNGLPDEEHYTSAYDLAQIGRAFFENEMLCNISTTLQLHLYPTEYQPDEIIENNATQLLKGKTYAYEYLVGCKTGYTEAARSCLVSCAEKDGMKLICVVMKDEAPCQYTDTIELFNYGFSNFDKVNISETETKYSISSNDSFSGAQDLFGNSTPILSLNQEDYILLPKTIDFEDVTSGISYVTENSNQAAIVSYTYENQYLGSASVDFSVNTEVGYDFESLPESVANTEQIEEEPAEDTEVVFINVVRILILLGAVVVFVLLILLLVRIVKYFKRTHPNHRWNWHRERRRRRSRSSYQNQRRTMRQSRRELRTANRRRRKGRKRISRWM